MIWEEVVKMSLCLRLKMLVINNSGQRIFRSVLLKWVFFYSLEVVKRLFRSNIRRKLWGLKSEGLDSVELESHARIKTSNCWFFFWFHFCKCFWAFLSFAGILLFLIEALEHAMPCIVYLTSRCGLSTSSYISPSSPGRGGRTTVNKWLVIMWLA